MVHSENDWRSSRSCDTSRSVQGKAASACWTSNPGRNLSKSQACLTAMTAPVQFTTSTDTVSEFLCLFQLRPTHGMDTSINNLHSQIRNVHTEKDATSHSESLLGLLSIEHSAASFHTTPPAKENWQRRKPRVVSKPRRRAPLTNELLTVFGFPGERLTHFTNHSRANIS